MCGSLFFCSNVSISAVRVRVVVVDHSSKVARVVGVVVIEAFLDELGMVVIAGKDDGLGQAVAAIDFVAVLHQVLQHLVHGVLALKSQLLMAWALTCLGMPPPLASSPQSCSPTLLVLLR